MNFDKQTIDKSINFYGVDTQSTVCMEECAELIQAISKVKRYGLSDEKDYSSSLIEEMADVLICIELLKSMYQISDENIQKWLDYKQTRIKARMKEG